MKTFIGAICILALLITGTWFYSQKINENVHQTEHMIERIEKSVHQKDFAESKSAVDELENRWNVTEQWFKGFMDHRRLDLINQTFYELKEYINEENEEEILIKCGVFRKLLNDVTESERLSLENVF